MKRKLEICCYTVESAMIAEKAGADRIELCDNYSEGSTTPSQAAIEYCLEKVRIPVNVMVRPRGGDFLYSADEFEIMKRDVRKIKELGANGIVAGCLLFNGEADTDRTRELIGLAGPMEFTFHRAFDMSRDPLKALDDLIDAGVSRILTSGGKNKAFDGIALIRELVLKAGDRTIIMPGSGVNETNITELIEKTNAREFHSSAKIFVNSGMTHLNSAILMGGVNQVDEYRKLSVDPDKIKKMKDLL